MFDKEKLTETRTMIKQEIKRRNNYGSELISSLADDSLDPPVPQSGEIIKVAHGKGIVDPLVSIKEFGDIKELAAVGVPIPDDFNEEKIYQYVNELRAEPMTGSHSSCRGACTGLCVGTCYSTCTGNFSSNFQGNFSGNFFDFFNFSGNNFTNFGTNSFINGGTPGSSFTSSFGNSSFSSNSGFKGCFVDYQPGKS